MIPRSGDVLLLDGGVDDNGLRLDIPLSLVGFDGPGQDFLGTLSTDPLSEFDEFRWVAGNLPLEGRHPAEVLPVGILNPLLHDLLIADVEHSLQEQQGHHDPNRDRWAADGRVARSEFRLQLIPRQRLS